MSEGALLFNVAAAGVGLWAIFKLALVGMYNYHLYRLIRLTDEQRRQRLGGLLRMESLEITPVYLIEALQEGVTVPHTPALDRQQITRLLAIATVCAISGTLLGTPTQFDLIVATLFPLVAIGTAVGFVGIHATFVEFRLWRQDTERCEELYQLLSQSDSERFPTSF